MEDSLSEDLGGVESQVVDGAEGEQGRDVLLELEVLRRHIPKVKLSVAVLKIVNASGGMGIHNISGLQKSQLTGC